VEIKINAPQLLERALKNKRNACVIRTGAMSDPYMPIPEQAATVRRCLEIIEHYGFGIAIQTKSAQILRDIEILEKINRKAPCIVEMTLTTFDEGLCKTIEPKVCTTKERFDALKTMASHGIKTIVWLSPILPFINDTKENIQGILAYCIEARVYGIICFGMGVTLRQGNREYFYEQLDRHFPSLKEHYQKRYGNAYILSSPRNPELMELLNQTCDTRHIVRDRDALFSYIHTFEAKTDKGQGYLF
jgi:DNA repair photolyase